MNNNRDKEMTRPPTAAELERMEREAMGNPGSGIDVSKLRKETISIKTMTEEERKRKMFENEYRLYELQAEFDDFAVEILRKVKQTENIKDDYGRSALPKVLGTIANYINNSRENKLNEAKFDWAKQVYEERKMGDFLTDLTKGVSIDIQVKKNDENENGNDSTGVVQPKK